MTTETYKVGPGTLTLGESGSALAVHQQMTKCELTPAENVTTEPDIDLLDGTTIDGEDTVSTKYTLAGSLLQDYSTGGVVDFTWDNNGQNVPFSFTPKDGTAPTLTGTVRVVALKIGGEAKKRADADFSWAVIGTPTRTYPGP